MSCIIGHLGSVWTRYYCTYEKSSKIFTMSSTEARPASRQVSRQLTLWLHHSLMQLWQKQEEINFFDLISVTFWHKLKSRKYQCGWSTWLSLSSLLTSVFKAVSYENLYEIYQKYSANTSVCSQNGVVNGSPEIFRLRSCVRRKTDSIDKRFCFDIEVVERWEAKMSGWRSVE